MSRFRRSPIALMALAALLVSAPAALAPPAFPPAVALPGAQTARFRVVVEGTVIAAKTETWTSSLPCVVAIDVHVDEKTTFRRGTGVVMEFVRLAPGGPIVLKRAGRRFDASLALTVTTRRRSHGSASRADPVPPPPVSVCAPLTEDLSTGPDCERPQVSTANAGLLYQRGVLSIRLNGLQPLPEIDCPVSEIRSGIPSLAFSWPTQPKTHSITISPGVIFGTRKVIVRTVTSGERLRGPERATIGTLEGVVTDQGQTTTTVRLIRVP